MKVCFGLELAGDVASDTRIDIAVGADFSSSGVTGLVAGEDVGDGIVIDVVAQCRADACSEVPRARRSGRH